MVTLGNKEFFPGIGKIQFEGDKSTNPLAFRYYDENRKIGGKSMKDHFRFAVAYWHSFCAGMKDQFGSETRIMPWNDSKDSIQRAKDKMDAAFEFITKMGIPYYCFHDTDLVDEGNLFSDYEKRLKEIVDYASLKQKASGVKLLWGTANVFGDPGI